MVAALEQSPKLTPEEYFVWEEHQEFRHEYVNGEVYAMTGGTVNHGQIAMNFGIILGNHLRGGGFRLLNSDVKVEIEASKDYLYPDVSVTCDEHDRTATNFISHPCLITEVLSPSTEAYDRGGKFKLYRRSSSLRDYVLVNPNKIEIDLYRRTNDGRWEIINYGVGDAVELNSINLTFPIEQVFEGIIFDHDPFDHDQNNQD
jgi:Uma2 family endonuclease